LPDPGTAAGYSNSTVCSLRQSPILQRSTQSTTSCTASWQPRQPNLTTNQSHPIILHNTVPLSCRPLQSFYILRCAPACMQDRTLGGSLRVALQNAARGSSTDAVPHNTRQDHEEQQVLRQHRHCAWLPIRVIWHPQLPMSTNATPPLSISRNKDTRSTKAPLVGMDVGEHAP
jgi:hypothetical protein